MRTLYSGDEMAVVDYRCTAKRGQPPFLEHHRADVVSYVRKGTFAYHTRGRSHDLVAGSIMLGRAGDDYTCSHEHVAGDECLAIVLEPALVEPLTSTGWSGGALPPIGELVVLGQLAEACAAGASDVALEEAAMLLVARTMALVGDQPLDAPKVRAGERRRMIDVALWIDARCCEGIDLEAMAREAALSPYHFLRRFRAIVGVTPHQYLIRCRLRRAARLLAEDDLPVTDVALETGFRDLSNFIRTFSRAARVSPREFRRRVVRRSTYAVT